MALTIFHIFAENGLSNPWFAHAPLLPVVAFFGNGFLSRQGSKAQDLVDFHATTTVPHANMLQLSNIRHKQTQDIVFDPT
ncbi:MAG: hypothetical protein EP335_04935 [Alphaproteobacteria bacterium]|nr:MAG: hypothetical protein EP335_04935 [Alphaproteobacteria bacterium]